MSVRRKVAARLRVWAGRLAPIQGAWDNGEYTPRDGAEGCLVIHSDGLLTGTTITLDGKPVENCVGFTYEINTNHRAGRVTLVCERVPLSLEGEPGTRTESAA